MSKSINSARFLGNVGRDPECRFTPSGTQVANFSIALSDGKKDGQGNWQESTTWVNLVAFGKTAEIVHKYVIKGSKLYVEAKFQERQWEKDGVTHRRAEFIVNDLVLLGERQSAEQPQDLGPITAADIPF